MLHEPWDWRLSFIIVSVRGQSGLAVLGGGAPLPRADFRLGGDVLDPHAPVKVIAVMCHPANARDRETILRDAPSTVVVPRHPEALGVAGEMRVGRLWRLFAVHRKVAVLAGALALALAQMSAFGQRGERQAALRLAATIVGAWYAAVVSPATGGSHAEENIDELQFHNAYRAYRGAAHLWAAVVYGAVQGRPDLHPLTVSHLPSFLAYAEEIARLATTLAWAEADEDLSLNRSVLWTFILPEKVARKAEALPLSQPNITAALAATTPASRISR
jgi:hypothetical protein